MKEEKQRRRYLATAEEMKGNMHTETWKMMGETAVRIQFWKEDWEYPYMGLVNMQSYIDSLCRASK